MLIAAVAPTRMLPAERCGALLPAFFASLGLLAVAAFAAWPQQRAMLLIAAPWLEEIVFRTGLHEALLRHGRDTPGHRRAANLITAALFAAAHVVWRADLVAGLVLLPALLVGGVYQRRRSVVPCVALHALFNGIWLLWAGLSVST
jgi:membrane protease YdiL (CAAX protease family)